LLGVVDNLIKALSTESEEEIEDPFGGEENDSTAELLAKNIHLHISEII